MKTSEEINAYIRNHWQVKSDGEIARDLEISKSVVSQRRARMGLMKSKSQGGSHKSKTVSFQELGELERCKEEVAFLRKTLKESAKAEAEEKAVIQAFREVIPARKPVPAPKPYEPNGKTIQESAVLLLGDIHYGETVQERSTGGIAEYSVAIAKARFDYTIDTAIEMAVDHLKGYDIHTLYVFGLGDWISGLIIQDIERWNEFMPVEQTLGCAEMAEGGLLKLCQAFPDVYFAGVCGNHSRLKEKAYYHAKQVESFDYLCYKYLEARLRSQPNLHFDIPTSFWTIQQVENTRFLVMHGDMTKSWGGYNMPIYGITRDYMKWRQVAENYAGGFHNLITGHWHTPHRFNMGRDEVIVNGSLKGIDDYGLGAPRPACPPSQMFFGVHPKYGITWDFRIKSEHVR